MTKTVFEKIIDREIPAHIVYEDEYVLAFLDLSQVTKGHTLVIPKHHEATIFDYSDELASQVFSRIPKIARGLRQAFPDMKGLNILNNNGEVAFQTVFHSHIHLIPRYTEGDDFGLKWADNSENYSQEDLASIAQQIHNSIKD
ncbi:HIT family protein [Atopobacter sp. AH10]|uniref:HIT family protein n=1 Tax=Atopobacter sp. AH10 TaxID=2315861 RepID=UPI000EF19464|nr:HIT family protein [Atopobacter sp. AH10]RLK64270.1 HIT family protein [Atopobacter sp. AH10]